ncbi:SpoIIIE family cell division protein [Staphylococcus aureus]|uniref:SpoIIIE family cell division protein n=1 Tax=Staphylococcus aureus TaxID=1280 RepID=A0A380ELL4_STAAU|nr:SpoIIIE family cell division protein [Staphylococcus aureus]
MLNKPERYVGDSSLNDDSDLTDNSTDASQLHTNGIENENCINDENKQASYKMKTLMTLIR